MFLEHHFISEGSCDTEVIAAEYSALPSQEFINIIILSSIHFLIKYYKILLFLLHFNEINAALVSIRDTKLCFIIS